MAVASTMLPLGTRLPAFRVRDVVSGKDLTDQDLKGGRGSLVVFLCRHCPYVKHVQGEIARIGKDYVPRGVGIAAISSNDVENYPDDAPEQLKQMSAELGLNFPVGYDASQEAAKAFRAACTPEFYLFDKDRKLVYRGQLDDSRPKNDVPVTGRDLRAALEALLAGRPIPQDQKPGIGCNIKWKPGAEPDYFSH
jgi:thiol-disulfide isomerase/thioredoxin